MISTDQHNKQEICDTEMTDPDQALQQKRKRPKKKATDPELEIQMQLLKQTVLGVVEIAPPIAPLFLPNAKFNKH